MNYAEVFQNLLTRTPSIKDRIHAFPKIALISESPHYKDTIFGRKVDSVYLYDKTFKDSAGNEVPVKSLCDTFNSEDGMIIQGQHARDIAAKLRDCGLDRVMDITHYDWRNAHMLDMDLYRDNMDSIRKVFALLDTQSAEMLYSILCFRVLLDPKIVRRSNYPQYFHPKLMPLVQECIIDGGAFVGDSALMFYKTAHVSAEIYSFEPDPENFDVLFGNIQLRGLHNFIHPFPWGLWSERTLLSFLNGKQSSMITEDGADHILTIDLDTFCQRHRVVPTIIKLDVEGAELHTLRGAQRIITSAKPKLMVCLYHMASHIWELPLLLKAYRDDYTFYLGHHPQYETIFETVLYAQ